MVSLLRTPFPSMALGRFIRDQRSQIWNCAALSAAGDSVQGRGAAGLQEGADRDPPRVRQQGSVH